MTLQVDYNIVSESFNVAEVDIGDVKGALNARFANHGDRYEKELEGEIRRLVNQALRGIR